MLNVLYCFLRSNTDCVMKNAVKRDITSPQKSVTAKPRMAPVPNWKRIAAVINDVMWESRMVSHAL